MDLLLDFLELFNGEPEKGQMAAFLVLGALVCCARAVKALLYGDERDS